jgi:hypothetical protein
MAADDWYLRWWLVPGEVGATSGGVELVFDYDDGAVWQFTLRGLEGEPRVYWDYDSDDWIVDPPSSTLTIDVRTAIRDMAGWRPDWASKPHAKLLIDVVARALRDGQWISGRKLRSLLKLPNRARFDRLKERLQPRYLREIKGDRGDYYSLTLPGLLASSEAPLAKRVLEALLATLRAKFQADPDVEHYTLDEVVSRGEFPNTDRVLITSIVAISNLLHGGSGSGHGSGMEYTWVVPQDVEDIAQCRTIDYFIEMARKSKPPYFRCWPTAPLRSSSLLVTDTTGTQGAWVTTPMLSPLDSPPISLVSPVAKAASQMNSGNELLEHGVHPPSDPAGPATVARSTYEHDSTALIFSDSLDEYDVFLSHCSADQVAVEEIAIRLRMEARLHPFLAKWHLIPGELWLPVVERALERSKTVAVFLGVQGMGLWHEQEKRYALDLAAREHGKRVIPLLLPGARKEHVDGVMRLRTWVELAEDDGFARLVAGITGRMPGPPELPASTEQQGTAIEDPPATALAREPLTVSEQTLRARCSVRGTESEIRRHISSDMGHLTELWYLNLDSLEEDDFAPHLRGIAQATQWTDSRHFDSLLGYALRVVQEAPRKDRVLGALTAQWSGAALLSALARRPPFSNDGHWVSTALEQVHRASQEFHAIVNCPNLAEILLFWVEKDPAAARAWMGEALKRKNIAVHLLGNLETQDEDFHDGYRVDVIVGTVGEDEVNEIFSELAATSDALTSARKAFRRALARRRSNVKQ